MLENIVIIVVAAVVSAAITYFSEHRTKSAQRTDEQKFETADKALDYAGAIAAAINPFLPAVADTVIEKVLSVAQQAVTHMEASYKAALAADPQAADTRNAEATSLIKSALALSGVEDTAEVDKLIAAVLPIMVLALPKTHVAA